MELIEPEVVPAPEKTRKKKPTLEEQLKDIPARTVVADILPEEEKHAHCAGSQWFPSVLN